MVSLIGFWLTVASARRAARSAENARVAAREALLRIRSQVVVHDLEESIRYLRSIRSANRDSKWDDAIGGCEEALTRLAPLLESRALEDDGQQMLKEGVSFLNTLVTKLDRLRRSASGKVMTASDQEAVGEFVLNLGRIIGRVQARESELGHDRES